MLSLLPSEVDNLLESFELVRLLEIRPQFRFKLQIIEVPVHAFCQSMQEHHRGEDNGVFVEKSTLNSHVQIVCLLYFSSCNHKHFALIIVAFISLQGNLILLVAVQILNSSQIVTFANLRLLNTEFRNSLKIVFIQVLDPVQEFIVAFKSRFAGLPDFD